MKVLYINILLFALPLNILVDYPKNTYITPHTPTTTSRLLCECDIYTSMYDNDPEMKSVMENYNRQTFDRFKEYDERIQDKRQKCKERCDKEIQKIVLKDKLEKELTQKFSTLETNMDINDMPTCVCKKSFTDKTEKFCLNCGMGLGSGVLQASSLLGGIGEVALGAWKAAALVTAKGAAKKAGIAAGEAVRIPEAIKAVISGIRSTIPIENLRFVSLELFINERNYTMVELISDAINNQYIMKCQTLGTVSGIDPSICTTFETLGHVEGANHVAVSTRDAIVAKLNQIIVDAKGAAALKAGEVAASKTAAVETRYVAAVDATYTSCQTAIIASVVAILIIVLVMVIIYLILHYRRKKKMKKKLQYIKLLKE
ncbi:PIR protein, putative [Plasmodium sp. gorilla clade G1]|nr:PIR protein, putative [Plasmodium sp. gorilla clade G1]